MDRPRPRALVKPPQLYHSSFHYYIGSRRGEYVQLPNVTFSQQQYHFRDFVYTCFNTWSKMNDEERNPFEVQAEEDKKRYEKELKRYNELKEVTFLPKFVPPKSALDPYYYYNKSETPKIVQDFPQLKMAEVHELMRMKWLSSPEIRSQYEQIYEEQKIRYESELEEFMKNCIGCPDRAPRQWYYLKGCPD